MEPYISKSALIAEINKLIKKNELYLNDNVPDAIRFQKTSAYSVLNNLLHFLDTLEVKEVDLEKEIDNWYDTEASKEFENVLYSDIEKFAKYFFELGLKIKGE